jgi:hypothetical protein
MKKRFRANLHVHSSQVGGRKHSVLCGFRCDWRLRFDSHDLNCGQIKTVSQNKEITPERVEIVDIRPLVSDFWQHLEPGHQIFMHEGQKQIGVAKILECFDA